MDGNDLMQEKDGIEERLVLAWDRILEIPHEQIIKQPYRDYFQEMARYLLTGKEQMHTSYTDYTLEELQQMNQNMYGDLLPEAYETSYGNPAWAVKQMGEGYGPMLSFLYAELKGVPNYAKNARKLELVSFLELFVQIYNCFEHEEEITPRQLRQIIYEFYYDNCDILIPYRIREQYDNRLDRWIRLVEESDLMDLRYLYAYGEYISEYELRTAAFLNQMPEAEIEALAFTYTDGYREGFEIAGIDLTKKKYVGLQYAIGQERIVRSAIKQFRALGLEPVIYCPPLSRINQKQNQRAGITGTPVNRQYAYDHRFDEGLYLDKAFMERKLEVLANSYAACKNLTELFAGPAVMETFGETPFEPISKKDCITLSDKQEKLSVEYTSLAGRIVNQYINRKEYSFTIIAYPSPEIGEDFEEIFRETVKVNTLDKKLYRQIQETMIEELNQAKEVWVLGAKGNQTNIRVQLHPLEHPDKETNFENCLADVNIPVGEVFTSPRLTGTNGLLNVSEVFLNGLKFVNLKIWFENGMIQRYTCDNFSTEAENIRFIKENLLANRETLPIGEFAIGTNTTAYVMANRFNIVYKLPILIVEKMGPHFAVGDTCYSYSEDNRLFNPDGKEIVAKDNECSIQRTENPAEAYFNCHTDITIPYDEIGRIVSVHSDGTQRDIIKDGRFVLKGTEPLNLPFQK